MKGSVQLFEVQSGSLEANPLGDPSARTTPVYLPPGYAQGDARYPVVYFLHAYTGSGTGWLNAAPFSFNVPERLDRLIAAGAPPCIGIFVDGWTSLGGSQWMNSEGIGRYRDYVAKDIVHWADKTFLTQPQSASRAIVGRSSGGFGALSIARFHTDIFGHVAVHSSDACFEYCYLRDLPKAASPILKAGGVEPWFRDFQVRAAATKMKGDDHDVINILCMAASYSTKRGEPLGLELPFALPSGKLRIDVWNRWLVHDPVRVIPKHLDIFKRLKSIYLDCGTRDEYGLRWGTRMMADAFREGGISCVHEEYDDGHGGTNYRFDASLQWLLPRLQASR